jgi:hypothetical protein
VHAIEQAKDSAACMEAVRCARFSFLSVSFFVGLLQAANIP